MTPKQYKSPAEYKQALEDRVRLAARARNIDMGRFRQILLFDRFLTRVFTEFGDRAIVKGGVVLELRLERARTTRDVDLWLVGSPDNLLPSFQRAGALDAGDYLSFLIVKDANRPTLEGDGIVYEGQRFRAEARLAGKLYGMPFGIDAAFECFSGRRNRLAVADSHRPRKRAFHEPSTAVHSRRSSRDAL